MCKMLCLVSASLKRIVDSFSTAKKNSVKVNRNTIIHRGLPLECNYKKNIIFLTVAMVDRAFMVDCWEIKVIMANTFLDHGYFIECTKSLF